MSATRATLATFTLAGLAGATALFAGTASAQVAPGGPPGACACEAPAPVVTVAPVERPQRWGVGLRASSMSLAPEETPDDETNYGGGGLALRYRLRPRWGLELAMDHFTEQLENGEAGTRMLSSVTLSASYHFRPYAKWDWYLLAGFGGTVDGREDITDEEREASQMGHAVFGAGIERRFRHFAIGAEVRGIGMAPPEEEAGDMPVRDAAPAMTTVPAASQKLSGGQASIAATYYF